MILLCEKEFYLPDQTSSLININNELWLKFKRFKNIFEVFWMHMIQFGEKLINIYYFLFILI